MSSHVEIADGVFRVLHGGGYVNSFILLEPDGSVTLVDTGLGKGASRISACLTAIGKDPSDVQRIVLTHAHPDHAGAAADMVNRAGLEGVIAHTQDAADLEAGMWTRPRPTSGLGRILARLTKNTFEPVHVGRTMADGQLIDGSDHSGHGIRVVHTPGHTDGHVALMLEASGVLITGDCIMNPLGRMRWAFGAFCVSPEQNRESAMRLADLEYSVAAFTHGPEIRHGAREAIRGFLLSR